MSKGTQARLPGIGRRRLEVFGVFFKIGALGFGIAAIWGLIHAEVQERRGWLSKERFVEGLALVQALPGATALQMCVFTGYQRAGLTGGVLAGGGLRAVQSGGDVRERHGERVVQDELDLHPERTAQPKKPTSPFDD